MRASSPSTTRRSTYLRADRARRAADRARRGLLQGEPALARPRARADLLRGGRARPRRRRAQRSPGRARPQDRVPLTEREAIVPRRARDLRRRRTSNAHDEAVRRVVPGQRSGGRQRAPGMGRVAAPSPRPVPDVVVAERRRPRSPSSSTADGSSSSHGAVVIAAITSCTNTSNPQRDGRRRPRCARRRSSGGSQRKPWVKSSLAPGSKVVDRVLRARRPRRSYLEELGFHTVGYGCTTCIGNSGPLPDDDLGGGRRRRDLVVCSVLSGQPQLRGAHPPGGEGRTTSPRRRSSSRYALAGRMDVDLDDGAARAGQRRRGRLPPRHLADRRGDRRHRSKSAVRRRHVPPHLRATSSPATSAGERSRSRRATCYDWGEDSTYVRRPPLLRRDVARARHRSRTSHGARCLVDARRHGHDRPHLARPARSSPTARAGKYLIEHGVERKDFNSYGSRRGNHEVMVRGTFANVRLQATCSCRAARAPGRVHLPERRGDDDLRRLRCATPQEGTPLIVIAGKEYGSGSSRDWAAKGANAARRARGDRGELRAHPPLEPAHDGHPPAPVPRRRDAGDARASPAASSSPSRASRTARPRGDRARPTTRTSQRRGCASTRPARARVPAPRTGSSPMCSANYSGIT